MSVLHACSITCTKPKKITKELGQRLYFYFVINSFQVEGSYPFSFTQEGDWVKKKKGPNVTGFLLQLATSLAKVSGSLGISHKGGGPANRAQ